RAAPRAIPVAGRRAQPRRRGGGGLRLLEGARAARRARVPRRALELSPVARRARPAPRASPPRRRGGGSLPSLPRARRERRGAPVPRARAGESREPLASDSRTAADRVQQ